MSGLTNDGILHAQIITDDANDDFSRIETNADRERYSVTLLNLLCVSFDVLLHPERGVAGVHGVILASERRTEQRHDSVAEDLIDGAVIAMDRLHHGFDRRPHKRLRLLGVAVGDQLH